ncbi:arabinose-proton symporter [Escherichia coli]|uniref:Arabinose-proton symporter n=1 Tax=Escherichia coli TaxID=562 RepID=A0A376TT78_ECOLX|nr:arabinose-proton symporter [Escherichia coli]
MAGAILFVLGSIGSAFATSVEMLIAARVVLGIAVGIASYTAPLYLSEMASENVRGKMISMYQLMVTLASCWRFYPIQRSVIAVTGAQCWGFLLYQQSC